jgi:formylglycine-generating enzyme required for sulfatase activity
MRHSLKSSFFISIIVTALFLFTVKGVFAQGMKTFPLEQSIVMEMASIPAGSFEMGDHLGFVDPKHGGDETPIHTVSLDAFKMGIYDVTNQQFCTFLNNAKKIQQIEFRQGGVYLTGGTELLMETRQMSPYSAIGYDGTCFSVLDGRENHPVVCIRWEGAAVFCNYLSSEETLENCYSLSTWECDFTKNGYRLPTEAEWEYGARGGEKDPYFNFPWGDETDATKANWPESDNPFRSGALPWTTPVGFFDGTLHKKTDFLWPGQVEQYQTGDGVNGYGLYDMTGNVWEFVNDWYGRDYYATSPDTNPSGPVEGSVMPDGKAYRGMRGGSWYNGEQGHGRVSNRNPSYYRGPEDPNHPYYHLGFRVVLGVPQNLDGNSEKNSKLLQSAETARQKDTTRKNELKPPKADSVTKPGEMAENKTPEGPTPGQTVGLFLNTDQAFDGYTLFAPKHNTMTYLLDNSGQIVHSWESAYEPGQSVYLKENGNLVHCCFTRTEGFTGGGEGGRVEEFDWEGNLIWEFDYAGSTYLSHHDIALLPNGNVLMLVVEKKTKAECLAAGFDPANLIDNELYPDTIVEVEPLYPNGGKIIWQWKVWDHLVQDFDETKKGYGTVSEHPELIDVAVNGRRVPAFWNHMNSIDYNAELDQIMLSVRGCNEIWILDHSTTKEEAAGHEGGKQDKGGDLLYRWGNPAAYDRGNAKDAQLIEQHDAGWIPEGYPGAGNILIFNNGYSRGYSTIEEITPPLVGDGRYLLEKGKSYGPLDTAWHYEAENPIDFFSSEISGASRLPNGNTLICSGVTGTFFEVTPLGEMVWQYVNPMVRGGILAQGELPGKDLRGHLFNAVFKIHRYGKEYPAFLGKNLTPAGVLELPASQKGKTGLDGLNESANENSKKPGQGIKTLQKTVNQKDKSQRQ